MRSVETTGQTIDEAILMAVAQLGVRRDELEIEVIEEPVKGLFGIFGKRNARIRATVKKKPKDKAKEFIENILNLMNMNAEVTVVEDLRQILVRISGKNMGILIGRRGEVLNSIQYLANLVANRGEERYKRIIVDVERYRSRREETLKRLARKLAYKVQKTKRDIVLEPMNPYERRIIHSTLQDHPYVTTYSEGEEPNRKVIITLK